MSTEWHFFAFDQASFERHVAEPLRSAAREQDVEAWLQVLVKLESVFPPARISQFGINGSRYPVTAVEWYTGRPDPLPHAPPAVGAESLDALLKVAIEALAEFRLVGRCFKPSGVFSELGFPERLPTPEERAQFKAMAKALFRRERPQPSGYEFLGRLNQRAGVSLPAELRDIVETEQRVGLLQRLAVDLASGEWRDLASDLASLRPFLFLAATRNLAVYYREDAT